MAVWVMGLYNEEAPELGNINDFLVEFRTRFTDEIQIQKAESEMWALGQGN